MPYLNDLNEPRSDKAGNGKVYVAQTVFNSLLEENIRSLCACFPPWRNAALRRDTSAEIGEKFERAVEDLLLLSKRHRCGVLINLNK